MLDGLTTAERSDVAKILMIQWTGQFGLSVANSESHGRWAIGIVSAESFALGAAPDALNDHQWPWYWTEAYNVDEPSVEYYKIRGQTRTQRRMPSRAHTLMFTIESASTSAGALKYDLEFRILYQLR